MATLKSFSDVLNDAIADFERYGFDNPERLEYWIGEIQKSAQGQTPISSEKLKETFTALFRREVTLGGLARIHKIPVWRLNMVAPKLRLELDRKLMASANLIKMNREEMVARTIRRFSGWATSIPVGGSEAVEKREVSMQIKKALKSLPYEERRVMIDQAAKFKSSLSSILATESGAIGGIWKSNFRAPGYDARPDHKERDGHIFLIRDSWAMKQGLVKLAGNQYTDEITQPAEEIFCSCRYQYLYNLRDLPDSLLTEKGREALGKK